MYNRIERIASRICCEHARHRLARISARIVCGGAGDSVVIEKTVDDVLKVEAGTEYECSLDRPQRIRYGRDRKKAVVSGNCWFSYSDDEGFTWIGGTWHEGDFRGVFSDGVLAGGSFSGQEVSDSVIHVSQVKWMTTAEAVKDGNTADDGTQLEPGKIAVFRNRLVVLEGQLADRPGSYDGFAGNILYNDTIAVAKDASFDIKDDGSFKRKSGTVVSGEIKAPGEYAGFTGKLRLRQAWFSCESASFAISDYNGRAVIDWKNGKWLDGRWTTGTWMGGEWMSGTWEFGVWQKGSWHGGKDVDGNEHSEPPSKWSLGENMSTHLRTDHQQRADFIDHVMMPVATDDTVQAWFYEDQGNRGRCIDALYNNGVFVSYSLDNPMIDGRADINASTGIPRILNVVHREAIGLDRQRKLENDGDFSQMAAALDIGFDEDGNASVIPLLKPRPVGYRLPKHLRDIALLNSLQETYNWPKVDAIMDFASNPMYRQVWERKLRDIESKGEDEFEGLYDEIIAIETIYEFLHFPRRTKRYDRYKAMTSRQRDIFHRLMIENGMFKSVDDIVKYTRSTAVDQDKIDKYNAMMKSRDVWK